MPSNAHTIGRTDGRTFISSSSFSSTNGRDMPVVRELWDLALCKQQESVCICLRSHSPSRCTSSISSSGASQMHIWVLCHVCVSIKWCVCSPCMKCVVVEEANTNENDSLTPYYTLTVVTEKLLTWDSFDFVSFDLLQCVTTVFHGWYIHWILVGIVWDAIYWIDHNGKVCWDYGF